MIKRQLIRVGNSRGLIIPKPLLEAAGLKVGDLLTIHVVGREVHLKKAVAVQGRMAAAAHVTRRTEQ